MTRANVVGTPIDRVDARAKVTGTATYAAETPVANVAHAVIVTSPIAKGTITAISDREAMKAPGVIAVLTHESAPRLPKSGNPSNPGDKVLQLLQDAQIYYADQPIAVVVADTLERAQHAASLVTAQFAAQPPVAALESLLGEAFDPKKMAHGESKSARGDVNHGVATAPVKISAVYTTPVENHNPMEPHATVAVWQGDNALTVYDATQGIFGVRGKLAKTFGLEPKQIRVISKYVGGGFGCKGSPWSHVALAVLAAKATKRAVKLAITRQQMFSLVGHRPRTLQTLTLAATREGKLMAMRHDVVSETSRFDIFVEPSAQQTRMLYSCENVETSHQLVRIDIPTPTFMRAPGESSGTFALESAMDELAYELKIDPLDLRIKNHASLDEDQHKPFSSKSLLECYRIGGEKFGWHKRNPKVGSMRDGDSLIGWGMATATYPVNVSKSSAIARLRKDGTVLVQAGTQDIGTGTYTIMAQIAADALGLPFDQVAFELGDSNLPETPVSGGSMTAASTGSAVKTACELLRGRVLEAQKSPDEPWAAVFSRLPADKQVAEATTEPPKGKEAHSCHSFGAVFVEVRVDADTCEPRVTRVVGVYGAGKILNPKTAQSQLYGGVVWGIGMALHEDAVRDARSSRIVTRDLADYHVPVNADIPPIDITFLDEHDEFINAVGAKGIGEIGITGTAAAIANAIYHATGKRVRDLPITLDKIMA